MAKQAKEDPVSNHRRGEWYTERMRVGVGEKEKNVN